MFYIYFIYGANDSIIYVGKSINLHSRISQHKNNSKFRKEIHRVYYSTCKSEADMVIYEIYYINKLKPKYNISSVYGDISIELPDLVKSAFDPNELKSTDNKIKLKKEDLLKKKKFEHSIDANKIIDDNATNIIVDVKFYIKHLSWVEKAKLIIQKYKTIGRKKRNSGGRTADIIADECGLARNQVYNYLQLQYLIPEFMNWIDANTISMKSALKLASFNHDVQTKLYNENLALLNNNSIKSITSTSYEEIITELEK